MKFDEQTLPAWELLPAAIRGASDCTGQNSGEKRSRGYRTWVSVTPEAHGDDTIDSPYRLRVSADSRTEIGGRAAAEVELDVRAHTSEGLAATIADGQRCGITLPPKAGIERIRGSDEDHGVLRSYDHSRTRDGRTGTPLVGNRFDGGSVTSGVGFTSGIGVVDSRDSKNQHESRQPLSERAAVPTAAVDYQRPAGTNARGTPRDARGVRGQ